MSGKKLPGWLSGGLALGALGAFLWLERRRPLRRETEPKLKRQSRNLAVAATGALAVQVAERPIADLLTRLVESRRLGILKRRRLPEWLEVALAVVLMDYTLYLWHVLTHRTPSLWRFHQPHHVDLDLDVSTALRFHFGELLLSAPWRAGQIILIGVSPLSLSVWQTALALSVMFHHSNLELPIEVERRLNKIIVTPRMHGIHHSIIEEETNSNWSSGLTIWDRMHRTLRLNVSQDEITIGVAAYRSPSEVTLEKVLLMPFSDARPALLLAGDA